MVNLKEDYNTTLLIRQVIRPKKTNNFGVVFNIYLSENFMSTGMTVQ